MVVADPNVSGRDSVYVILNGCKHILESEAHIWLLLCNHLLPGNTILHIYMYINWP